MNNITYLKLKNLETGNRILNVCNKNMEEINKKLDKFISMPEIFFNSKEIRKLNLQFDYYRAVANRILKK